MKKSFFWGSIFVLGGSIYAEEMQREISCFCENEYYAPACCDVESCDEEYSSKIFITGDFLYWYAKETDLVLAQKASTDRIEEAESFLIQAAFYSMPAKFIHLDEEWNPGFRVGIGWESCCLGWDLYLHWTYFSNKSSKSASVLPIQNEVAEDLLLNPWSNPIFGSDFHLDPIDTAFYGFAPIYTSIGATWKERLNVIDLELGKEFCPATCFSFRPFFGVRGAWDRNRFEVFSELENTTMGLISANTVNFENDFWGVGILGGFQPNFYLTQDFSVFGNADFALLWGRFKMQRSEQISFRFLELSNTPIVIPKTDDDISSMQAIIDLAIGLHFEKSFCCDAFRLAVNLGWEQHIWFHHHKRFQLRTGFGGLSRDSGFQELDFLAAEFDSICLDFVFGGGVIRAQFEF